MVEKQETPTQDRPISTAAGLAAELLPAFQRLDARLGLAIQVAEGIYGSATLQDRFRGLYVDPQEAREALEKDPGEPALGAGQREMEPLLPDGALPGGRLDWLARACGLSAFDLDILLLALAPEIDRRYERIYAYLQDHVARRRPTVDLALSLLCQDVADRLDKRKHFDPEAPLIRHQLVRLLPESNNADSLLSHAFQLDESITRFLLHQDGLDPRLTSFCRFEEGWLDDGAAFDISLPAATRQRIIGLVSTSWEEGRSLRLYFEGPAGSRKASSARALAGHLGAPLLVIDLALTSSIESSFQSSLQLALRFAWLQDALICIEHLDVLRTEGAGVRVRLLLDFLADETGIVILTGTQPWSPTPRRPLGLITVLFPPLDYAARRACWQNALARQGFELATDDLEAVSTFFRLRPGQIDEAVAAAAMTISIDSEDRQLKREAVFAAAQAQSGLDAGSLARKVQPLYTWKDIVLPADSLAQLREICGRVAHARQVLGTWGFEGKLSQGKGVAALFSGPSGTGKTMAAEIIANELGLSLYKIDLSGVVSKYIGETEKNLDRIFTAAEDANAILFFDEADALFGKRSEVRDSHDRYANIEISYLLQKMEAYTGLAILATNLKRNLDESFTRRLAFTVHFPFPDAASRARIWTGIWPRETPLAEGVNLAALAEQFALSGGNIKNAALAAAFLAAADDGVVTMDHLLHAVRREYQKLSRTLSESDLDVVRRNHSVKMTA